MATVKQKIVATEVLKGRPITKAMKIAGYSDKTAANTHKITASKGWQELMDTHIGEKKLAALHKKLLNKKEIVVLGDGKGYSRWEYTGQPHSDALKALEQGYRLRGRYVKETEGTKVLIVNITEAAAKKYAINPSPGNSNS